MNRIILFFFLLLSVPGFAQVKSSISIIDFVKVKNNKFSEALFYYENNWKVYREIALKSDFIASFKLLRTTADSLANFDLILITDFRDSLQFKLAEERFQKIISVTRPEGSKLMNDLQPKDFRQNVFVKQGLSLFSSE